VICEPAAVPGEEIAARVAGRNPYVSRGRDPYVTGALGGKKEAAHKRKGERINEEDEFEDE
jgi:hypothetical protein